MNFALILLILLIISGLIVILDTFYLKYIKFGQHTCNLIKDKLIEYSYSFFPIFLIVLILRSFFIEPFRIPSGSLEPTLKIGDFVAVNKFIYGIRLPIIEKKIFAIKNPQRGDIVVFRWPPSPNYDYIKRLIGVAGDHISYQHKRLIINNNKIPLNFIEYTIDESSGRSVARYTETINKITHDIYLDPMVPEFNFDIIVPKNSYFMMGDNRDNSADSRFWGFVDDKYLRGKAFLVWMSWDRNAHNLRWSSIGHIIH